MKIMNKILQLSHLTCLIEKAIQSFSLTLLSALFIG